MPKTKDFATHILEFLNQLSLDHIRLPKGVGVMNPYKDDDPTVILQIAEAFYKKFYSDHEQRRMILGINPGRLGSGSTGIPFTDTKRLSGVCGINLAAFHTHEPSSVFVYDMIEAYGGVEAFYSQYYITSACPLGFLTENDKGNWVNYNYYDSKALEKAVTPYITQTIWEQLDFGIDREVGFCWGTGKNYKYLKQLNDKEGFFKKLVPLEHPRYIIQYKSRYKDDYIAKYLEAFRA